MGTNKWIGTNGGDPWALEIEVDRMSVDEPFTVSVWVSDEDVNLHPKTPCCGAFLSAEEAREAAAFLLAAADGVDAHNAWAASFEDAP